jgi:ABC-type sulfate transport system substrate-binding protein
LNRNVEKSIFAAETVFKVTPEVPVLAEFPVELRELIFCSPQTKKRIFKVKGNPLFRTED